MANTGNGFIKLEPGIQRGLDEHSRFKANIFFVVKSTSTAKTLNESMPEVD
jgi:hypothetical protein